MAIKKVGVIGSGTMGNGIAQVCATAGLPVVMVDISEAAVTRGLATLRNSLDRLVKKGTFNDTKNMQTNSIFHSFSVN
jgi:3-hydroxybutyryl-CoA dehydrogenase